MNSSLHLFLLVVALVPLSEGCFFRAPKPDNSPERFKTLTEKTFERQLADKHCFCGVEYTGANMSGHTTLSQSWILYIHLNISSNETKICVGTVVNSNMVITSHRCLQKKGNITVDDVWRSRMNHSNHNHTSSLACVHDITLSTETDLTQPINQTFTVKKIIYSERFAYDSFHEQAPETDIAILVVDYDFIGQPGPKPICIPRYGQLNTNELLNREGYYQGIRHYGETKYFAGIYNFSTIRIAAECNKGGKLGVKPASNDTLCLMFTQPGPTIEGGPIRITVKRLLEGGPRRSFLVGIASWVDRTIMNGGHNYAYFANINAMIKYIEQQAEIHNSTWCPTPHPDDKYWPWEGFSEAVEESLDCQCGFQKEPESNVAGRIGGGEEAEYNEFPWLVRFQVVFNHTLANGSIYGSFRLCGGSVINDRMLMTAAHCFVRIPDIAEKESLDLGAFPGRPEQHRIYLHSYYSEEVFDKTLGIEYYKVRAKQVLFHPGFPDEIRDDRVDYDIALLILEEPLTLGKATKEHKRIDPICLPKRGNLESIIGHNVTVAGWGLTNYTDSNSTSFSLRKLNVPIRPLKECAEVDQQLGQYFQPPTDTKLCASWFNPHENAGQGDSGGPLMHQTEKNKFTQVGIVSYLNNAADGSNKSVTYYANVEAFLPYIHYYSKESGAKYCKN